MDRPEHQILLACSRAGNDPDRGAILSRCAAARIDWGYLLQTAAAHRLTSLLYWHLNLACRDAVPSAVLEQLHQHFLWNSGVGLLLMARLQRILSVFDAGGVPAIPYKGPVLAHTLYENPALREFDDLDILVQRDKTLRALGLLVQLGYEKAREYPPRVQAEIFKREHHCTVTRNDGTEPVEMHWNVVTPLIGPPIPLGRWWARAERIPFGEREVLTLSPEDLLVALLVHGSVHLWASLRWVADVSRLIARHAALDWDYVWSGHRDPDLRRMIGLGLLVARDLADAAVPDTTLSRARADRPAAALAVDVREGLFQPTARSEVASALRSIRFQVRARARWSSRLAYPFRIALTPTLHEWDVALPIALFPLYFALRPVRLLRKHATRLLPGQRA